jgi:MFS transporter, DHA1 family, multidrug resistance protein
MFQPESRAFVLLLGALTLTNSLGIDMVLPAMPELGSALTATPGQVQLTLSLFVLAYAVGQLICGPLADRYGRRPILLLGLGAYVLTSLACALSRNIETLVAARVVQGCFACGGPVMARAVVRDHFSGVRAAQMLSSLTSVFALGPLIAPLLGGIMLVHFGWQSIFLFLAAWALIMGLLVWGRLPESLKNPDHAALQPARLLANFRTFVATRRSLGYAFVVGFCWIGIFAFLSGSPFVFIQYYGVSPDRYGLYFGAMSISLVFGALTNRRLLRRFPTERVLLLGFAILLIGGALTLFVPLSRWSAPLPLTAAMVIFFFGQTIVQPNAVAAALDPLKHMAGMGASLIGSMQMIFGSLSGYAVNALYNGTPLPMCGAMLFAAVSCSLLYFILLRRRVF